MIVGVIEKILNQKENDWGRYQLNCLGKKMLCVGIIPSPTIGMRVTLEGRDENTKYGPRYKITSVLSTECDDNAGVRRFLADGYIKGIGSTKANAIIECFGKESADLFDTPEGRAKLCTVKGISNATIENAMESYEANKKYKDIVIFLKGSGTKSQVENIYKKYEDNAIKILTKNPYRLQMDLDGFGFLKADAIALASGIKKDSIYRIMAASKYALENATSNGHCYLTVEEIEDVIIPLLVPQPKSENKELSEKVIKNAMEDWEEKKEKFIETHSPSSVDLDAISQAVESRNLIKKSYVEAIRLAIEEGDFVNVEGRIYTKKMYEIEKSVADMVAKMCAQNPVRYISKKTIEASIAEVEERKTNAFKAEGKSITFNVTEEQRKAVYLASMHRISIISGGPGRGKTAISEIVAHSFMLSGRYFNKEDIIMIAPTGRAAQRISESTGYNAMTAHRAVLSQKKYGAPKGKLVLCDESSMVDIFLASSILKFAQDCNLILVGDVDQIASVGPGKVLKDMIDSGVVPYILLKEGHRNSGSIAHNAALINAGVKISGYCYDDHFIYTNASVKEVNDVDINGNLVGTHIPMMETIVFDYKKKVDQYGIENVMLCAAMRERGPVSVNKLNDRLQKEFTSGKAQATYGMKKFRIGDRVMQTVNDYEFIKKHNGLSIQGVFNGEKGTVVKVLPDPEENSYKLVVLFDDGSIGGYTKSTAPNLVLAYATTLHKCQGSEAACMMMAYTYSDFVLLNRALFYTGETRAKKEFRFYGEEQMRYGKIVSAFDIAVGRTEDIKRNTFLKEMLIDRLA